MPNPADGEIRCKASQTCPDAAGKDDLQLSVDDGLHRIDDPMRLLAKAQRRGCRERCDQQLYQATRPEPDPRHDCQRGALQS